MEMTRTRLAEELDIMVSLLNELINGKRDSTIEYAMMIQAVLGIDADLLKNMQANYNKWKVKQDKPFMERLARIRRLATAL